MPQRSARIMSFRGAQNDNSSLLCTTLWMVRFNLHSLSCIVLILSRRRRERIMEVPVDSEPSFVPFTFVFFAQHSFRVRNTACGSHHFMIQ